LLFSHDGTGENKCKLYLYIIWIQNIGNNSHDLTQEVW